MLSKRETINCKEITISPVRAVSSQAAKFLQGGTGNSDHGSNSDHMITNNNNALSYVFRQVERLARKDLSLTADKRRSWFELTITELNS